MRPHLSTRCWRLLPLLVLVALLAVPTAAAYAGGDGCDPLIMVDQPTPFATLQGGGMLAGWALDQAAADASDTGIADVAVSGRG